MPLKPIELPRAVARRSVDDMRAFHAEDNAIKRDEIAARQLHALCNITPTRCDFPTRKRCFSR
jgi:hypothetical protein